MNKGHLKLKPALLIEASDEILIIIYINMYREILNLTKMYEFVVPFRGNIACDSEILLEPICPTC